MDHFTKFVRSLSPKLRTRVLSISQAILQGQWKGLDIKPLRGEKGWYRCRIRNIRILFYKKNRGEYAIYDANVRGKAYRIID